MPDVHAHTYGMPCPARGCCWPAEIRRVRTQAERDADGQALRHIEPRATEYTVCPLPEDNINAGHFSIRVAYRGRGLWAVLRHRYCLGSDGEWDYESIPSEREDEWLATHRFELDVALRLAAEHVTKITVNGWTVADALAAAERRRNP